MRFLENGPSIPDDLLNARDEGRVVFFCGAGVSRARAGLSNFLGLAEAVMQRLHVPADNPAYRILNEAREMNKRPGGSGLISADRIFGLLERDYLPRDIEVEVAKALQPLSDVDLSAHRILIDLATTPEGKVRLVTTNFDRLFDDCNSALNDWQPPRLPDPSRQSEMDGIIHLHGRAKKDYSGAEGDGFILSSSEFGRAYLAEGWATKFFKEIIDRYIVVFVGYTADDPPVLYLLEALNKKTGQLSGVYAFQAGTAGEALVSWQHKGIEAIAYDEEENHQALWETLEAWAARARAPEEWCKSVVTLAKKGPKKLLPHERGQVAHLVSTREGARKFAESDDPPPAEWLCVFDPVRRYAKPGRSGSFGARGPYVDPFDWYGLDADVVPNKIDPDDHYAKREVPENAWEGLAANQLDRQCLRDNNLSALRGHWATNHPQCPLRLIHVAQWISKVANQPAAVWWAACQTGLHPSIQKMIQREFGRAQKSISPEIRRAWGYLFEAWEEKRENWHLDLHSLKAMIDKDGWHSTVARKYNTIIKPYLKVGSNYYGGPTAPESRPDIRVNDMLKMDVEYPLSEDAPIPPDEWLVVVVRDLRNNLEHALQLERELGGYGPNSICPITPDDLPKDDGYGRTHGLSGYLISFSALFARLIDLDSSAARQEFAAWPVDDDTIFSRLRIWASGRAKLIPAADVGPIIARLSNDAFWDSYHQRDLLLALAKRWQELTDESKREIEHRLLAGPPRWDNEEDAKFDERRAGTSLIRITWLANNGCDFPSDLTAEIKTLKANAPRWKQESKVRAIEPMGVVRGGWVKTETGYSLLLHEPLRSTLSKARELSEREEDDFLVEKDPFAGLSAERPVRALSALTDAARRNEYPEWAWRTFLDSVARKDDKPKFSALVAERLCRYPLEVVTDFIRPATDWLLQISKQLASGFPETFDKVISKLIIVLRSHPPAGNSSIVRGSKEPDWAMEALNSPVGKIARALLKDPRRKDDSRTAEGFSEGWLTQVNALLSLDGDLHRHALVMFAYFVNWFYSIAPHWTEANLLSALDGNEEDDRNAFWAGFLWGAKTPNQKLYLRMKPSILAFTKKQNQSKRGHIDVLAAIILAGWGSINDEAQERLISHEEMHDVLLSADDEFRSRILWQLERWTETKGEETDGRWSALLPEFFQNVWPRQKSAKTQTMSAHLCDLAFSNAEHFSEIIEIILPLLTPTDLGHLRLPNLKKTSPNIVDRYPHQTLALLHAALPDDVTSWPYGIEDVLKQIGEADGNLKTDERWLELNRKWNAR